MAKAKEEAKVVKEVEKAVAAKVKEDVKIFDFDFDLILTLFVALQPCRSSS